MKQRVLALLHHPITYILIALCAVFFSLLVFFRFDPKRPETRVNPTLPAMTPSPTPDAITSVLLLGRGGASHDGGALTDTISIVSINPQKQRALFLSLPRDLWVTLPDEKGGTQRGKINAAYALGAQTASGAAVLARDVISQIVSLPIHSYIVIDFDGFTKAIDTLGGVDLYVQNTFTDYEYPIRGREKLDCTTYTPQTATDSGEILSLADIIKNGRLSEQNLPKLPREFPCRYQMVHFEKGQTHMDGAGALTYVRSRHSLEEAGDFSRSTRQKNLLSSLAKKLLTPTTYPKLPTFFTTLAGLVETNITVADLPNLLSVAMRAKDYPLVTITPSTQNYLKEGYTPQKQYILTTKFTDQDYSILQEHIQYALGIRESLSHPTIFLQHQKNSLQLATSIQSTLEQKNMPTYVELSNTTGSTSSATLTYASVVHIFAQTTIDQILSIIPLSKKTATGSAQFDILLTLP